MLQRKKECLNCYVKKGVKFAFFSVRRKEEKGVGTQRRTRNDFKEGKKKNSSGGMGERDFRE